MPADRSLLRTALPPSARLIEGALPCVDVETRLATARVYFHGAHLAHWQPAHASVPVLFMSRQTLFEPGKPIRGGVPICFPWFGPHPLEKNAPAHGFARIADWTLSEASESPDGTVSLSFSLQGDPADFPSWPYAFRIAHRITIGSRLTTELKVENRGEEAFTFTEALHTYFAVCHIDQVHIDGLENTEYLDKVAAYALEKQGDEPIRFGGETDRVYLDTTADCVIHDPGNARRMVVAKSGSKSTVVWNPWTEKARSLPDLGDLEWREMVCVETANVGDAAVRLDPGQTHVMTASITVSEGAGHTRIGKGTE